MVVLDVFGVDPDMIDACLYGGLLLAALEPVGWWLWQYKVMKPTPRVVTPALLSALSIVVAAGAMVFVTSTLIWPMAPANRLFWNPVVRRVQGAALFGAVVSHWWWRLRR